MMEQEDSIGTQLRELRAWRGLTVRVVAELAGMSAGHVSNIENGARRVDRRSTLEALAAALRVAPSELAGTPIPSKDPLTREAYAGIAAVEGALGDYGLGQDAGVPARPWAEIAAELHILNTEYRPRTDYVAQGLMVPRLIADLHASYNDDPDNRREALVGLMHVYHTAAVLTKNQGVRGLPQLAAFHARRVAEELDAPQWLGLAEWLKGHASGSQGRLRQYDTSVRAANELEPFMDSPEVVQVYGMLHLNAALASAAQRKADDTSSHLGAAAEAAGRLPDDVGNFGHLYFGPTNVDVWRVSLATELGERGRVAELARAVQPEQIPSAARQAMFHADVGRALAGDRRTRAKAVEALLRAESIAPQRIRTNPFVRETVTDLVQRARHDALGRELRGIAYRMGLAS